MTREMYESPEFDFQEMKLAERVAETCWGYAYAWYDANGNGQIDPANDINGDGIIQKEYGETPAEKIDLKDLGLGVKGCQGSDARNALTEYFKTYYPDILLSKDDVSTNVKAENSIIDPISK